MEMYAVKPKPKDKMKDKWDDLAVIDAAVPGKDQPLESIPPTKEENACTIAASVTRA